MAITYKESLEDPRWQKRRLEILSRDNFTCQKCFDSKHSVYVHHRAYVYGRAAWDHPDELLVTLCKKCHDAEHKNWEKEYARLKRFLCMRGYFSENIMALTTAISETVLSPTSFTMLIWMFTRGVDPNEDLLTDFVMHLLDKE
jgi:hypothetical protein